MLVMLLILTGTLLLVLGKGLPIYINMTGCRWFLKLFAMEESSLSMERSGQVIRSVIDTKESDGIADPMKKIAIKSHTDHSDSRIGIMLILIDTYFVILCNAIR